MRVGNTHEMYVLQIDKKNVYPKLMTNDKKR